MNSCVSSVDKTKDEHNTSLKNHLEIKNVGASRWSVIVISLLIDKKSTGKEIPTAAIWSG